MSPFCIAERVAYLGFKYYVIRYRFVLCFLIFSSADGTVRIYEAPDVMNLSQWSLQYEIPVKIQCRFVALHIFLSSK
jgi:hypothetical protein